MNRRNKKAGVTRRAWAALLAAAPLLAPATFAQVATTPQNPPPVGAPQAATPAQDLAKSIADVHTASDKLSQVEVPMTIEPAFTFHV